MERWLPLGDHLLQAPKVKIQRREYMKMFTLFFQVMDVKEKAKDDPCKLERLKQSQVEKNFHNWLVT